MVPSLARVIALAKAHAPDVLIGRANEATARSELVGAELPIFRNPYMEITGERATIGRDDALVATATAWVPFEIGGQRSRRIDAARAAIALQRSATAQTMSRVMAGAFHAFGLAVVGGRKHRVLEELQNVARSEAEMYRARFKAGDATAQDARLAEVDVARYGVLLAEATADIHAALSKLEFVTGRRFVDPPIEPVAPPRIDLRGRPEDAPSVRLAKAEAAYHARQRARWDREGAGTLSAMVIGGADGLGGTRVGGGLAYAFPVFHAYQGERAREQAEHARALVQESVERRRIEITLTGLERERADVELALSLIDNDAEPAAMAAVDAAVDMRRLGKGELLAVLTTRRDLALLRIRRLDLLRREWEITGEEIAVTGRAP